MLGGVAEGLSARTGIDLITMRVLIVLATLISGGAGAAAYVIAWLLIPEAGQDNAIISKALADKRGIALAAGIGSLLIVLLIFASAAGISWIGGIAWALTITVVGMVLVVRNATPEEQATIRRLAEPLAGLTEGRRRSQTALRLAIAVVLLGTGLGLLLLGRAQGQRAGQAGERGRAAAGRDRARARPLVAADRAGPGGRAPGPGPGRGARRHGGPGARLGAADAGPDPAPGQRPAAGHPAGPGAGAGAAELAVRRPGARGRWTRRA